MSIAGVPLIADGTVQTYRVPLELSVPGLEGPWTHLGIWVNARRPDEEVADLEVLSVRVISRQTEFAGDRVGVRTERSGISEVPDLYQRVLYSHAPGRIGYRVRIPEQARLDLGLGAVGAAPRMTFQVSVQSGGEEPEILLEHDYVDDGRWAQRSVDLSHLAGRTVTLTLGAESERSGAVALWAAPPLSGSSRTERPNVIFYVIDGGGAEHMSVYGYNRRT